VIVLFTSVALVAGCGLPRSGPNKREILSGSVDKKGDAFVVTVTPEVSRLTAVQPKLRVQRQLPQCRGRRLGHDLLRRRDQHHGL
jgi:polysaccharide export outer membrane protein